MSTRLQQPGLGLLRSGRRVRRWLLDGCRFCWWLSRLASLAFQFGDAEIEAFDFVDRSQVSFPQKFDDLRLVGVHEKHYHRIVNTAADGTDRTFCGFAKSRIDSGIRVRNPFSFRFTNRPHPLSGIESGSQ